MAKHPSKSRRGTPLSILCLLILMKKMEIVSRASNVSSDKSNGSDVSDIVTSMELADESHSSYQAVYESDLVDTTSESGTDHEGGVKRKTVKKELDIKPPDHKKI